jgi:hypothetical protein
MDICRSLSHESHSVRITVTHSAHGWSVRQDDDREIVRDIVYDDWHRVERALSAFERRARTLRARGWIESEATSPAMTTA